MINVYNIISGFHDSSSSIQFNMFNIFNTRGNQFKMHLTHIHCNIRKHFFSNRIIAVWMLPNDVVYVDSTNILKNCVDMFWYN